MISHDRRAIDHGIPNQQIAPHHDCNPRFTERSSSMTPGWKFAALIAGTGTPTSKDRELPPFVGSLLSQWDAGYAADRSAQSGSRVKEALTPRERDVLAMISQGFSNKHIARTLEISPETVKTHVKRIFLKLAVNTRTEAVYRAASLGLLGLDSGDGHGLLRKQQSHASQGKIVQEVDDGM
jgi:DNA-binding CsgD family transcriptional regulator